MNNYIKFTDENFGIEVICFKKQIISLEKVQSNENFEMATIRIRLPSSVCYTVSLKDAVRINKELGCNFSDISVNILR